MTEVLPDTRADQLPSGRLEVGTVVTHQDRDGVVIGYTMDGQTGVCLADGVIAMYGPEAELVIVADPERSVRALRAAVVALEAEWSQVVAVHIATLADIRGYAIRTHEAGSICREGLDDFLAAFGLPAYEPRLRVSYAIRGSDEDGVRANARHGLAVDAGEVGDARPDGLIQDARVTAVEALDR